MLQVTEYEVIGKGRLRVCFDNGARLTLYRGEAKRAGLKEQGCVTEEDYELLLRELGKRATRRAMHLLEQMDRTEHQLREKLARGDYPETCIEEAISYVKRFRYLDDLRYACSYVRCHQEKLSRQNLAAKLVQRGVKRELIEQAIEEEYEADETNQIRRLLVKRQFVPGTCDEKEFRRTYQYLMRRGFSGSDVLREMRIVAMSGPGP